MPLWRSMFSFTMGTCFLAKFMSLCKCWFNTSACDSFSWAWSSFSLSSLSCHLSSAMSLMQASCSMKRNHQKGIHQNTRHKCVFGAMITHFSVTDLFGQQKSALVASTMRCCQLCSPKVFFSSSLCGEPPLHTAYQPLAAQSDTQPLQGHHLFSSIVAIMDNFLEDEKLRNICTMNCTAS